MRDCIARIVEYTAFDGQRFESSRLVQDATVRNLQTLTESSQRLSDEAKAAEPGIPLRELSGFRNVLVHGVIRASICKPSGPSSSRIYRCWMPPWSAWQTGESIAAPASAQPAPASRHASTLRSHSAISSHAT